MIVRRLENIVGTERDVEGGNWYSRRLLLAADGLSYSLHDTVLRAGTSTEMWYRNHLESVYCIEGEGVLVDRDRDEEHEIRPGTLYVLDAHDRHTVIAHTDLRMVCVFTPPVTGNEVHLPDGSYPAAEPAGDSTVAPPSEAREEQEHSPEVAS
ncbi:MAG: ectoine synthase [Acidimicrobiia bacterium]|nr:ectoine synthase [Acidimicrobiia bacterium]